MKNEKKLIMNPTNKKSKLLNTNIKKSHHKEKIVKDTEKKNITYNTIELDANQYDPHCQDIVLC